MLARPLALAAALALLATACGNSEPANPGPASSSAPDPTPAEAADPTMAEAADPTTAEAADPTMAEAADPTMAEAADPAIDELTKQQILDPLEAARPRIRACYQGELDRGTEASVKLVVRFNVQPDGTVADLRPIEDGDLLPTLTTCVLDIVQTIRFAPSKKGVSVTFPFLFNRA
jgi:outer membrane biosynthesis protein TonB